jgi:hypothetical protein
MQQSFQEKLKNVTAASMISRIGRNLALQLRTSNTSERADSDNHHASEEGSIANGSP